MGAGFASEGAGEVFGVGDDRLPAAGFQKVDHRLYFGGHGTFGEVRAFSQVTFGLGEGHLIQEDLLWRAIVETDLGNSRADDKQFGAEVGCQQGGGVIFVNDGRDAAQVGVIVRGGTAPSDLGLGLTPDA